MRNVEFSDEENHSQYVWKGPMVVTWWCPCPDDYMYMLASLLSC